MSALYVPTFGDRPGVDPAPEFYGPIPQSIWRRKDISLRAKVILGALGLLCRGSKTWCHASIEMIAIECGLSARVTRKGLAELTAKGVIVWEAIEEKFQVLFRLRGKDELPDSPAPRIAPDPISEPKREPKREPIWEPKRVTVVVPPPDPPIGERASHESSESERKEKKTDGQFAHAESASQSVSFDSGEECEDHDPHRYVIDTACSMFDDATEAKVRLAIDKFGDDVEIVLERAANREMGPPDSWGWVLVTLEGRRREGAAGSRPTPKPTPKVTTPLPPQQNYNPGIGAKDCDPSPSNWRQLFNEELARIRSETTVTAQEKTGDGVSRQKVPPSPAAELIVPSDTSYCAQMGTASAPEDPSAHSAPRASNPPSPAFQASPEPQKAEAPAPSGRASRPLPILRTPASRVADQAVPEVDAPRPGERPGDVFRRLARSLPLRC
jgi:hypothetical protein